MTDQEAYSLAKDRDPRCIPHLLAMITTAALKILQLESRDPEQEAACRDTITGFINPA
jgi:hypothetical protein